MNKLIESLKKAGLNISAKMESIIEKCVGEYIKKPESSESGGTEITDTAERPAHIYTGTRQKSCARCVDSCIPLKQAVRRKYFGL